MWSLGKSSIVGSSRAGAVFEQRERSDGGFELEVRSTGPNAVHFVRARPFAAVIPGDGVAEQVITTGINQFLSLYNAALIGRLIITWFPNPPQFIAGPLATICDPYLNLFRGIIPPLGGTIDLSPILAFIVLDLFTNSAAALPAEIGTDGKMKTTARAGFPGLSQAHQAWKRRAEAAERKRRETVPREMAGVGSKALTCGIPLHYFRHVSVQSHPLAQCTQNSPRRLIPSSSYTRKCVTSAQNVNVEVGAPAGLEDEPLVYAGVVFDMASSDDGTLSVSCIDYQLMRDSIDIPEGDLFTVMETWSDGERIKRSMDTILEIEAVAAAASTGMPGLRELLDFLRAHPSTRVGLVTRNTPQSVDAFFDAVGEDCRDVFDILLTREAPYVKPDKRCLLHFAQAWSVPAHRLLMVGDSTEDVECGNAAGTATCLISGGGNEIGAGVSAPPPGAVPTFAVDSLHDLKERLRKRDTALGWGAYGTGTLSLSSTDSDSDGIDDISVLPGAPPPGLDFLDWLFSNNCVEAAACSFPRIDGSRFGVPPDAHPGSKVLHLQCGDGALTKLLFSAGLLVVGADPRPAKATKRGLAAAAVDTLGVKGALDGALATVGAFDAVVLFGSRDGGDVLEQQVWKVESLQEIKRALRVGGKLCVECEAGAADGAEDRLEAAGFDVVPREAAVQVDGPNRVRLVATRRDE